MKRVGFALALLLAPGVAPAATKQPPAACLGRYLVPGPQAPLIEEGLPPPVDAVILTAEGLMIRSGCPLARPRIRDMKNGAGWRVRVGWATCSGLPNVRLRATLSTDCAVLKGRLLARNGRVAKRFTAAPSRCGDGVLDPEGGERCEPPGTFGCDARCRPASGACGDGATWDVIQQRIFTPTCALSTCHGGFAQAHLDLLPGAAYPSLVDVLADNPAARAAGKKLVVPGDPASSFLSQKLHGTLGDDEGARMPLVGPSLSPAELQVIDAWIAAGAQATGAVAGAPCLPAASYEPAPPLPLPPGGYQLVLDGPMLAPGEEQEGCYWIPVPNATDFFASKFEFSLNPGTHHFAIFPYQGAGAPETGVWQPNNFGCFNGAPFAGSISGAPHFPYYVDAYPAGVARLLKAGSYIGLNAHYHNGYDVPIQIKVWSNVYPYEGTPAHVAETLQDLGSTFSIRVPPFTQQVHRGRFVNTGYVPLTFLGLAGHMHFRGLRFTAWQSDGTKVYESFDWAHPLGRGFDPPFVLRVGDWVDYECLYDNGLDRPVRKDAYGNPTDLIFGVSTEDAMCILTGAYYIN